MYSHPYFGLGLPSPGVCSLCGRAIVSIRASSLAQMEKNLPKMWETWIRPLGQEDLLEKGIATHSSILVGKIP